MNRVTILNHSTILNRTIILIYSTILNRTIILIYSTILVYSIITVFNTVLVYSIVLNTVCINGNCGLPGRDRTSDPQLRRLLLYPLSYGQYILYTHYTLVKSLADSIGFEPMRPFLNDSLANCCLNHSANYPCVTNKTGGPPESRTPHQRIMSPLL